MAAVTAVAVVGRLVPGPTMERGHALNLYAHPKEPKLVYCFGKYVVARNLNDSGDNQNLDSPYSEPQVSIE